MLREQNPLTSASDVPSTMTNGFRHTLPVNKSAVVGYFETGDHSGSVLVTFPSSRSVLVEESMLASILE
jgi:hypothetical protein